LQGDPSVNLKALAQEFYQGLGRKTAKVSTGPHLELNLARHPAVRKELRLTPEQEANLDVLALTWGAGIAKGKTTDKRLALGKQTDAELAAVLTPHQVARLRQIDLQRRYFNATFPTNGLFDPALTGQLKLSPKQQTALQDLSADTGKTFPLMGKELNQF